MKKIEEQLTVNIDNLLKLVKVEDRLKAKSLMYKIHNNINAVDGKSRHETYGAPFATELLSNISNVSAVPYLDIVGRSRKREYVDLRHFAFWAIRTTTKLPLKKIGKFFERDHATVLHGISNFENLVLNDEAYYNQAKYYIITLDIPLLIDKFELLTNKLINYEKTIKN